MPLEGAARPESKKSDNSDKSLSSSVISMLHKWLTLG